MPNTMTEKTYTVPTAGVGNSDYTIKIRELSYECLITDVIDSTHVKIQLSGFDPEYFQNWYMQPVYNASDPGGAPQGDSILITDYDYTNGECILNRAPSGADLAVGDKVKLLNPVLVSSLNTSVQASDVVKQSDTTENSTTAASWAKVKSLTFEGSEGSARIKFQAKTNSATGTLWVKIYKNGVNVNSDIWKATSDSYQSFSQDVGSLVAGDTVELWAEVLAPATEGYIKEFTIGYDIVSQPAVINIMQGVYVDTLNGYSGTDDHIGTAAFPSNNLTDALAIAQERGLFIFYFLNAIDTGIKANGDFYGYTFIGPSGNMSFNNTLTTLDVNGHSFNKCIFKNLKIYDEGLGLYASDGCYAENCVIAFGLSGQATLKNCFIAVLSLLDASSKACLIDCSGSQQYSSELDTSDVTGQNVEIINFKGYLLIGAMRHSDTVLNFQGQAGAIIEFFSNCLAGTATIYGIANIIIDVGATTTIVDKTSAGSSGALEVTTTTIDLNQAAANYTLFTGTTQAVLLQSLVFKCPTGAAGGALTSISIQTDDATPQVIIPSSMGAVANLTSEAQIGWTAAGNSQPIYIGVGKHIQITITGGATGTSYICTVVASYQPVVSGGSLT